VLSMYIQVKKFTDYLRGVAHVAIDLVLHHYKLAIATN